MFRWPQSGISRCTESSNLSGEEVFLQPPQKHDDRCAFKQVLITDRGFKAASWTLESKNGNVQISLKLNSTSGTTGEATADKMTAKVAGKNSGLHFSIKIYLNMRFMQQCTSAKF